MEALVELQTGLYHFVNKSMENFRKKGQANMTRGAAACLIERLQEKWDEFRSNHQAILELGKDRSHLYFKNKYYDQMEETYWDRKGELMEYINVLNTPAPPPVGSVNTTQGSPIVQTRESQFEAKLPRIDLPKFNGDCAKWSSFEKLFDSLVIFKDLDDVAKLHYLVTSLEGEAYDLVKDVDYGTNNFADTWKKVTDEYDNTRRRVSLHLSAWLSLGYMKNQTSSELKILLGGTTSPLASLTALKRPTEHWDDIFVHVTVSKLDDETKKAWLTSLGESTEPPTFAKLKSFLTSQLTTLETIEASKREKSNDASGSSAKIDASKKQYKTEKNSSNHHVSGNPSEVDRCPMCNNNHLLSNCFKFKRKTARQRHSFAKEKKLCYNCLKPHLITDCDNKSRCVVCTDKHHTLLHLDIPRKSESSPDTTAKPVVSTAQSVSKQSSSQASAHLVMGDEQISPESVLLATARIYVRAPNGNKLVVRALIDQCAQSSFISEALCQRLRLPRESTSLQVSGIGKKRLYNCKSLAQFTIQSLPDPSFSCPVTAAVLPSVSSYRPLTRGCEVNWSHLHQLELADPKFCDTGTIDVLLSAAVHGRIVQSGVIKGKFDEPIATQSHLGWLISGATAANQPFKIISPTVHHCSSDIKVNDLLQKFWQQEEVFAIPKLTPAEQACEDHFNLTHSRGPDGVFTVRLPFKTSDIPYLGDTYQQALHLLHKMESRFKKDEKFKAAYHAFMREYLDLNHMRFLTHAEGKDQFENACFLPHHGIQKENSSTTKLRVVFNGSAKSSKCGVSLNDCLHIGPNMLPDLAQLLTNWREYKFVFVSDVEKMYRQIRVHDDDQIFQLILWRFNEDDPVSIFALLTVTYGINSSPYDANRVKIQLATDEQHRFPLGAEVLREETYMDDVTSGGHTLESARAKSNEVLKLCKVGGLTLRKWLSNNPTVTADIPTELLAADASCALGDNSSFAILGLHWHPKTDDFSFTINLGDDVKIWNKRRVLSQVAKLFDPLGFMAPVIVLAKIFLQKLWLLKLLWDDNLPSAENQQWLNWYKLLPDLSHVRIPRWLGFTPAANEIQLVGFADASKLAYGAVVYLRSVTASGVTIRLIQSKSKVAPIKTQSIVRLELSAAHLLAKLVAQLLPKFNDCKLEILLGTDSLDVMHYLREIPSKWPTFVANRCADVHTLVPQARWLHVRSEHNPADLVSRGITASELKDAELWWNGPAWLREPRETWPNPILQFDTEKIYDPESPRTLEDNDITKSSHVLHVTSEKDSGLWVLLNHSSSLSEILGRTVYILRCIDKILKKNHRTSALFQASWYNRAEERDGHAVTAAEWKRARNVWIYLIQHAHFSKEIEFVKTGKFVQRSSSLFSLNPILHEELLVVGGRLKHSLLTFDKKHPVILPPEGKFTELVVRDCHARTLHGGVQLTLFTLRNEFWLIKGRQRVKSIIHECVPCTRYRATQNYQMMGNLPADRVTPSRPFSQSGVDYAGPYHFRTAPGRGQKSYKGYVCIFICLCTRSVHLEAVSDYSTAAFLAAFRRFTARRGHCRMIRSDQGTTFVGADSELRAMYQQSSAYSKKLTHCLTKMGTEWRFNPPAAPHFGGIWEAAVKSTKHHLKRVIGDSKLTYEEFSTLLCQIESCLNSRPLAPLSDDPLDLQPLSPAHFLIQSASYLVPEPDCTADKIPATKRWLHIQQMLQQYWQQWSKEYLQTLQRRNKWQAPTRAIQEGDLVLIRRETTAPAQWPLARVTKVHFGDDQLPRVVTVKTAQSSFDRPVTKLVMLPLQDEAHTNPQK